ncbi:hypothetical protein, partial [Anaerotignum sp.]|uniref:hypothetical protein n=1 Tax=Anaerotignum sp. TaxID=2039241 RepID=UPI0028AFDB34
MKFKLGLTMSLCVALGTANVAVYANEPNAQAKKLSGTTAVGELVIGTTGGVTEGTTGGVTEGTTGGVTEGT